MPLGAKSPGSCGFRGIFYLLPAQTTGIRPEEFSTGNAGNCDICPKIFRLGKTAAGTGAKAGKPGQTDGKPGMDKKFCLSIAAAVVENREILVYNEQQTFIPYAKTEHGAGNAVSPPFDFGRMFCYELSPVCQADPASD